MRRSEVKSEGSTKVRSRCCFLPRVKGHFEKKKRGGGVIIRSGVDKRKGYRHTFTQGSYSRHRPLDHTSVWPGQGTNTHEHTHTHTVYRGVDRWWCCATMQKCNSGPERYFRGRERVIWPASPSDPLHGAVAILSHNQLGPEHVVKF